MNKFFSDFQPIWITILSAVVSFVVSTISNRSKKGLDFEYDYRSYILLKRKDAYNVIEQAINELNSINEPNFWTEALVKIDHVVEITQNIASSIWLTPNIKSVLYGLIKFKIAFMVWQETNSLHELSEDFAFPMDHRLIDEYEIYQGKYYDLVKALEMNFFDDILKLDDIKGFKKATKKQRAPTIKPDKII